MTVNIDRRTQCVRFEALDGTVLRFVLRYPADLVMSNGSVYMQFDIAVKSDTNATVDGAPTVIDIGSVYDIDAITREEIDSCKWDGARIYSFYTDWANPIEDDEPDRVFQIGKVREEDERFTVELSSLLDLLNQTVGRLITPGCLNVFCDSHVDGQAIPSEKSRCKKVGSDFDVTGVITSVSSNMQFRAAALDGVHANDWFGNGELIFTLGNNAGLGYSLVKAYNTNGTITLSTPAYFTPQIGDQFKIRAGCRKRFAEDCVAKFANGKHFGGFPHVPQKSTVSKFGDQ